MAETEQTDRLSLIATRWSLVFQAHQGERTAISAAQQALLERYCGAIYRYLRAVLRDADTTEELCQEFALRFVRGDFKHADPARGRFRDYVKSALYHLIVDHHRRRQKRLQPLPTDSSQLPAQEPDFGQADQEFLQRWRAELLDCTWHGLQAVERQTGRLYYTVLRWRADHPQAPALQLAQQLQDQLGKPFTDNGVRQTLHRAREKFAQLLLEEVARSLQTSEPDRLEQELIELGLLAYCQPALDQRGRKP
jgi:RNA polymerase sigma-70 factor (ECF subfamily)